MASASRLLTPDAPNPHHVKCTLKAILSLNFKQIYLQVESEDVAQGNVRVLSMDPGISSSWEQRFKMMQSSESPANRICHLAEETLTAFKRDVNNRLRDYIDNSLANYEIKFVTSSDPSHPKNDFPLPGEENLIYMHLLPSGKGRLIGSLIWKFSSDTTSRLKAGLRDLRDRIGDLSPDQKKLLMHRIGLGVLGITATGAIQYRKNYPRSPPSASTGYDSRKQMFPEKTGRLIVSKVATALALGGGALAVHHYLRSKGKNITNVHTDADSMIQAADHSGPPAESELAAQEAIASISAKQPKNGSLKRVSDHPLNSLGSALLEAHGLEKKDTCLPLRPPRDKAQRHSESMASTASLWGLPARPGTLRTTTLQCLQNSRTRAASSG